MTQNSTIDSFVEKAKFGAPQSSTFQCSAPHSRLHLLHTADLAAGRKDLARIPPVTSYMYQRPFDRASIGSSSPLLGCYYYGPWMSRSKVEQRNTFLLLVTPSAQRSSTSLPHRLAGRSSWCGSTPGPLAAEGRPDPESRIRAHGLLCRAAHRR